MSRPRAHDRTSDAELAILTATDRLLSEESLVDLSVAQIMKAANVSRGTFYHYFSSKFAVVAALLERVRDELYEVFVDSLEQERTLPAPVALRRSLEGNIALWGTHRGVLRAVREHWRGVPGFRKTWLSMFKSFAVAVADRLETDRATGAVPAGRDSRELASAVTFASERCLFMASLGVDEDFPDQASMADYLIELWVGGLYGARTLAAAGRPSVDSVRELRPVGRSRHIDDAAGIYDATRGLLKSTPFVELSVRQIHDAAGVTHTTFYRHFKSKFEVVARSVGIAYERVDPLLTQLDLSVAGRSSSDVVEIVMAASHAVWRSDPTMMRAGAENWQHDRQLQQVWIDSINRLAAALARFIDDERARGNAKPGVDSRRLAKTIMWAAESSFYISGLKVDAHLRSGSIAEATSAAIARGAIYG